MSNIKVFKNEQFGALLAVEIAGEPWFDGNDIAVALGYNSPWQATRYLVAVGDKRVISVTTPDGTQPILVINESGLYSLILSSKLPTAREFKHWVTSEVLPSIRKSGDVPAGQEATE